MEGLEQVLREHPFFASLEPAYIPLVANCARSTRFEAGQYLFREGESADEFFLIRDGRAALEIAAPGMVPVVFETLSGGEIAGASWLAPPYRWAFDARAVGATQAIGIDARRLRGYCDASGQLGCEITKCFLSVMAQPLDAMRLQFMDVYARA